MTDNKLIENIQTLAINKRLNFLIGAGASAPAIPITPDFEFIKDVSRYLVHKDNEKSEYNLSCDYQLSIISTLNSYQNFIKVIIDILQISNSRQTPKSVNIFSTNYDLFVEKAVDDILKNNMKLVFNDGANGYFNRYLNSHNFDKATSYRGQFEIYNDEIPSISLIKPHGSVNWEKAKNEILIHNDVYNDPMLVKPNGKEAASTFESDHFFAMLRLFQEELNKEESILIVVGFSFNDEHIMNMVQRALQNPSLIVYVFAHSAKAAYDIDSNFNNIKHPQLNIIKPEDVLSFGKDLEDKYKKFELKDLTKILNDY